MALTRRDFWVCLTYPINFYRLKGTDIDSGSVDDRSAIFEVDDRSAIFEVDDRPAIFWGGFRYHHFIPAR